MFPHGREGIMLDHTLNNVLLMLFLPLRGAIFPCSNFFMGGPSHHSCLGFDSVQSILEPVKSWNCLIFPDTLPTSHPVLRGNNPSDKLLLWQFRFHMLQFKNNRINLIKSFQSYTKVNINNGNFMQEWGLVDNIGGVS